MELVITFLLVAGLAVYVFWLAGKILQKAGLSPKLAILLIVPVVNIFLIWVFAFTKWPNLKNDVQQDL